jgi:hypothetical protein
MMNLRSIYLLLALSLLSPLLRAQVPSSNLEELVGQRRWGELRVAATQGAHLGFYRAMAAAVFNDPESESLFKQVIREEPASEHAYEAYDWLANNYQKSGRYHSLALSRQAQWKAFPDKTFAFSRNLFSPEVRFSNLLRPNAAAERGDFSRYESKACPSG